MEEKVKALTVQKFNLIATYFENNDAEYRRLVRENYSVLERDHIHFNVYATNLGVYSAYSTQFEGKVHDNGYSYCYTTEGNSPLNPLGEMLYPSKLKGKVDYLGNIRLYTDTTGISLFSTLPEAFEGSIGANGERLQMRTSFVRS
jgi:hypothetical protein